MATLNEALDASTAEDRQLKRAVDVKLVGDKLYQSVSLYKPKQYRAVYGGLVMSQALMAATKSVSTQHSDFLLHSFHCYFVGPTRTEPPVVYQVSHAKDGKNFCSLTVKAMQGEKTNFHCMASFYKPISSVVEYQARERPSVPKPSESTLGTRYSHFNLAQLRPMSFTHFPMDIIVCAREDITKEAMAGSEIPPRIALWIRGKGTFNATDPQNHHRITIVYASDILLARLVMNKYPSIKTELVTSLDHSVWFHCDVQADHWYLYVAEVERAKDGRSLTTCRIYAEDGTMVATCNQESLIRPKL